MPRPGRERGRNEVEKALDRRALDWLPQARVLLTVKTDCDLSAHMQSITESLAQLPEDKAAMLEFFARNGFKSWLREMGGTPAAPKSRQGVTEQKRRRG